MSLQAQLDFNERRCKQCAALIEPCRRSDAEFCNAICQARFNRKTPQGHRGPCRVDGCATKKSGGPFCAVHAALLVPEGMRACSSCLGIKAQVDFSGKELTCKSCLNNRAKDYRARHPDRIRDRNRRYRESNQDTVFVYSKNKRLLREHGITLEQFNLLFESQNGRCAICRDVPEGKEIHLDHDHATGRVRGILCSKCNAGLGLFADNPLLLREAANYVEKQQDAISPTRPVLQEDRAQEFVN